MTTETEATKRCVKCEITKPTATEFYRETKGSRGREGGFRAVCKACWNGGEPEVTEDERNEFAKRFVVDHIKANGETVDEFFRHFLPHRYPEITKPAVDAAIRDLIKRGLVYVSRRQASACERINWLALA